MRIIILLAISLLTACSTGTNSNQQAVKQVSDFYGYYLPALLQDTPPDLQSQTMQRYIASDTLNRIATIRKIPEEEILGADYFTYTQDYDQAWVPALKVGSARDLMGGKVVDVSIGIEDGKHKQLEAYVRKEDGAWKIYRVRDISGVYEAQIFDTGRIKRGW